MGPLIHTGLTLTLLVCAGLVGWNLSPEVLIATVFGGVLIDGDKIFEMINNRTKRRRGEIPDITARWRILHSILAFPFGAFLSILVNSALPFLAVLGHIFLDSFVPGITKDGKDYPSHSRLKWTAFPNSDYSWKKVTENWPITYPPQFNWIYKKLCPVIGALLILLSSLYLLPPYLT